MSRAEDAVTLAGRLGEHGVQQVELIEAGGARHAMHTRETDLPGILRDATAGTRLVWLGGEAEVREDAITWVFDPLAQ